MRLLQPVYEQAISAERPIRVKQKVARIPVFPLLRMTTTPPPAVEPAPFEAVNHAISQRQPIRVPNPDTTAMGVALHYWLELIHNHWHRGWSAEKTEKFREALNSSLLIAGLGQKNSYRFQSKLLQALKLVLGSKQGRAIISPKEKALSCAEIPVYARQGQQLRRYVLDRIFTDGKKLVIVDYKSGGVSEERQQSWDSQLAHYKGLIDAVLYGHPLETFIYHPESDRRFGTKKIAH